MKCKLFHTVCTPEHQAIHTLTHTLRQRGTGIKHLGPSINKKTKTETKRSVNQRGLTDHDKKITQDGLVRNTSLTHIKCQKSSLS